MTDWSFYPRHTTPAALDIVWCRFPFVEDPDNPAPKERPALVRRPIHRPEGSYIEVAFGTSNPRRFSEHDLYIANLTDLANFGLSQATIFMLDRTEIVPWAEEWCVERSPGDGPVIGQLNERYKEYLKVILRGA